MSGGNWERVASYVNNGHSNITGNGGDLATCAAKYKDVYKAYDSNGAVTTSGQDVRSKNYDGATPENGKYGDAVYETSANSTDPRTNSWYSYYSYFPGSEWPFFDRGGGYNGIGDSYPVSYRNSSNPSYTSDSIGFRCRLYIK